MEISRHNWFFLFFVVDIVMRAWADINVSLLWSVCNHEIFRTLTRPVPHAIVLSWVLQSGPVRRKEPPVAGISVLNLEPSSTVKKVAIQPSQTSIAALLSRYKLAALFSNPFLRSFFIDEYLALLESRSALSNSPTILFTIGFHKYRFNFHRNQFFTKNRFGNSSEPTSNTTFERRLFMQKRVHFMVRDLLSHCHARKDCESTCS